MPQAETPSYYEYIASPEWAAKREECLLRFQHRCAVCNSRTGLQAHHREYKRLGNEYPEDLVCLCAPCHRLFSDRMKAVRSRTECRRTEFVRREHEDNAAETSSRKPAARSARKLDRFTARELIAKHPTTCITRRGHCFTKEDAALIREHNRRVSSRAST